MAIGLGVAASVAGVMVVEYLALTRLAHAVSGISFRQAAAMVFGLYSTIHNQVAS